MTPKQRRADVRNAAKMAAAIAAAPKPEYRPYAGRTLVGVDAKICRQYERADAAAAFSRRNKSKMRPSLARLKGRAAPYAWQGTAASGKLYTAQAEQEYRATRA